MQPPNRAEMLNAWILTLTALAVAAAGLLFSRSSCSRQADAVKVVHVETRSDSARLLPKSKAHKRQSKSPVKTSQSKSPVKTRQSKYRVKNKTNAKCTVSNPRDVMGDKVPTVNRTDVSSRETPGIE